MNVSLTFPIYYIRDNEFGQITDNLIILIPERCPKLEVIYVVRNTLLLCPTIIVIGVITDVNYICKRRLCKKQKDWIEDFRKESASYLSSCG